MTASSLYDFIDHQVKHPLQRPTFFGEMAGRIVLMHYPDRAVVPEGKQAKPAIAKVPAKPPAVGRITTSGDLLLLDGRIYKSRSVREQNDGSVEIEVAPRNGEEEAALRSLRTDQFARRKDVSFAFRNLAFKARVGEVSSLTSGAKPAWSVALTPVETSSSYMSEAGLSGVSAEELARMPSKPGLAGGGTGGPGGSERLFHAAA